MEDLDCLITVVEGKDLAAKDANGLSDPYVKIEVLDAMGAAVMRKETAIVRYTLNPSFGYRFFGRLPAGAKINFEVWDYDRLTSHDFMGLARVSIHELRNRTSVLRLVGRHGKDEVSGTLTIQCSVLEGGGLAGSHSLPESEWSSKTPSPLGLMPVHRAAHLGHVEALRYLKTQWNVADGQGWMALDHAVHAGHETAVRELLAHSADSCLALSLAPSVSLASMLVQDARHRGRLETAAGERRETAVLAAGRQSRWDVVLLLLAVPANALAVDVCERSLVGYAVRDANLQMVTTLVSQFALPWSPHVDRSLRSLQTTRPQDALQMTALLTKLNVSK